jgi:hypothetical protein
VLRLLRKEPRARLPQTAGRRLREISAAGRRRQASLR